MLDDILRNMLKDGGLTFFGYSFVRLLGMTIPIPEVYLPNFHLSTKIIGLSVFFAGSFFELGQYQGWISGTYDGNDIIAYALGTLSAYGIDCLLTANKNYSKTPFISDHDAKD